MARAPGDHRAVLTGLEPGVGPCCACQARCIDRRIVVVPLPTRWGGSLRMLLCRRCARAVVDAEHAGPWDMQRVLALGARSPRDKVCPRCGHAWPRTADYFHRNRAAADGLQSWCKPCMRAQTQQARERAGAEAGR